MIKKWNWTLRIKKSEFWILLFILAAIEIDSLPYIMPSSIATFFNFYLPVSVCIIFAIGLVLRKRVSNIFLLVCVYFVFFLGTTLYKNSVNVFFAIRQIAPLMAITILTEFYMKNYRKSFIQAVYVVLFILIIMDILSIIMYPEGLYSTELYTTNWFLGYKTARVRLATLPIIMFAGIHSIDKYNKLNIWFWISSILALVDTFLSQNTGGVVTIIVMLIMLFLLYFINNDKIRFLFARLLNPKILFIIVLILTVVINLVQNVKIFEPIVVGLFNKDITFTNRTMIWASSLEIFQKSPFIGNGYILNNTFGELIGSAYATQAHSLFLSVLVYTGIIGMIIFLFLLYKTLTYVDLKNRRSTSIICATYIICILIQGIVSIHLFTQFFYSSMIMLYYLREPNNVVTNNRKSSNLINKKRTIKSEFIPNKQRGKDKL